MKQNSIKIGNRKLENYGTPFITAEVGVNHNGSLKKALKMIDIAKETGCDAVKFQTFRSNEIVQDRDLKFTYVSQKKKITERMDLMFKRYELKESYWKIISDYCKKKKIIFFSTPQNLSDLKILMKLNVPAIKVGSDDFVNINLIKNFIRFKKPIILSTGMSTEKNFDNVLKIRNINKKKIIFLLCTSEYPTSHINVNINKIDTIKKKIGKHLIGFSDHTQDNTASIMAVAKGCCFFEKHFTLNNNQQGPDHAFSCNPFQLKSWVNSIRNAYKCMGDFKIKPTKKEKINKEHYQRKIIAKTNLKKGSVIKFENVILLRTSDVKALPSDKLIKILGRKVKQNIKKGDPIKL